MKKWNISKSRLCREILFWIVRVVCLVLIVYSIVGYIKNFNNREDSKYTTFILQSGLLFLLTFCEITFKKLFKAQLPNMIQIMFLLFCTGSILLGEIAEFYVKFSWWDDLLHIYSGGFVCELGVLLIIFLNEKNDVPVKLSTGFVIFFAFVLSMSVASIWEMFEYAVDKFTNSNMQRAYDSKLFLDYGKKVNDTSSEHFNAFVGSKALDDTMSDIIECFIGTICVCLFTFWDLKRGTKKDKINDSTETESKELPQEIKNIEMDNINKEIIKNSEQIKPENKED